MAAFGIGPLIAASIGIILMGLLRTPLRWSGAAVLALAVAWALIVPQPDILISGDGRNVAARGKDGRLHLMRTAKDAFLVKEWLAADADPRATSDATLSEGVSRDEAGCVVQMADGLCCTGAASRDARRRLRACWPSGDGEAGATRLCGRRDRPRPPGAAGARWNCGKPAMDLPSMRRFRSAVVAGDRRRH